MADTFVECLVSRQTPAYAAPLKIGLIAVACIFFALGIFNPLFWLVTVIVVVAGLFIIPGLNVEYEYTFIADQLNVDKIVNRSKRKKVAEYMMSRVDVIAPVDSREIMGYAQNPNNRIKPLDFTSGTADNSAIYGMIYNGEKGKIVAYFEPNEKLIKALKAQSPNKVTINSVVL